MCATQYRRFIDRVLILLIFALASTPLTGNAQYPIKPITVVVPFTVGTGMDIIGRTLSQSLAQTWGQAIVVDNRAGASGNLGTEFVAKANPDGYTLLLTGTSFGINPAINKSLRYDPVKNFESIIQLASATMSLVVNNKTPVQSVRELVDLAKKRPGELNYGSPGNGTLHHVTMELFKNEAGISVTHIPYKGTTGAINDIVGGQLNVMFLPMAVALPLIRNDAQIGIRMIAILSNDRSQLLPNVPTMKEIGYANVHTEFWYGLFAPAGTPNPIIARLNAEVNSMLQAPFLKDVLVKQGMNPLGGTALQLSDHVKSEITRWQRVVAAAKIQAD